MEMREEDFNEQFEAERKEMADLEYSDPLSTITEDEDLEILECSCLFNPDDCPIHNPINEDEE